MKNFNNSNENENIGFTVDKDFYADLPEDKPEISKPAFAKELIEWLDVLCVAIIAVVVVFSFLFRVATIDGESMMNTLNHGDRVIITNMGYTPKQGDIVVVSRNAENSVEGQKSSEEPIIKRVIAVGGQTVDIDFKTAGVYVDGVKLEEPYLGSATNDAGDVEFPLYIPEGHIFILGDNRGDSLDSRFSRIGDGGIVDNRYVLGHAVYRFFPFSEIGVLK